MATDLYKNNFIDTVKSSSRHISKAVADTVATVAENTSDAVTTTKARISVAIDEKKTASDYQRQEKFASAFQPLEGTAAGDFVLALGDSPVKLSESRARQIKSVFPVPREQNVLWADAEFDLRPSGIVATDRGVFIRTNVGMLDGKKKISNAELDTMTVQEQEAYKQHLVQYHGGKSVLLYYSWDDFDAA